MEVVGEFVAGWFAGCAGVLVAQPMDTVKVRMQVLTAQGQSAFSCFVNIVKHETVLGLYKGLVPPLLAVGFQNAVLFGVYGNILNTLSPKQSQKASLAHISIAGAVSGAAQVVVICPLDLVKIKLQMQMDSMRSRSPSSQGSLGHFNGIYRTFGIRGLFQGGTSVLLRDVPGFVTYFTSYEILLDLGSHGSRDNVGPLATIIAGGLAGMISWASTFPLDVVKSRMQADGSGGKLKYSGMTDCILKTYSTGGVRSFFRGIGPTLLRAFPTNAVIFPIYTFVSRAFSRSSSDTLSAETKASYSV